MDVRDFEFCCGAEEIGNLAGLTTKSLRKTLKEEAKEREKCRTGDSCYMLSDFKGAWIATTVPSQRGAIRALKANKFKKVFTFTNPGTNNKVTLWAKKLVR